MHRITSFSKVQTDPKVRNIFCPRGSNDSWKNREPIFITESEKLWRSAILKSDIPEISRLLSNFPDLVNWKEYITGNTALHFAAKDNDMALLRLLVGTYKADVGIRNHGGLTPLHMAALGGSEEVAFILVDRFKADSLARDYSGNLPAAYLPQSPKGEAIKKFLKDELKLLVAKNPDMEYLKVKKPTEFHPIPRPRKIKNNNPTQVSLDCSDSSDATSKPPSTSNNSSLHRLQFGRKSLRSDSKPISPNACQLRAVNEINNASWRRRSHMMYVSAGVSSEEQIEIEAEKSSSLQSPDAVNGDLADTIYNTVRRRRQQMSLRFNPMTRKSNDDQDPPSISINELLPKPIHERGSIFSLDFSSKQAEPLD